MDFISLNVSKDINILSNEEINAKVKLIEEYANGGMEIINSYLGKSYYEVDKLIEFVKEFDEEYNQINKKSVEDLLTGLSFDI